MKYRVVRDKYLGFEAQYKVWYWPFWRQVPKSAQVRVNTWKTKGDAINFVRGHHKIQVRAWDADDM